MSNLSISTGDRVCLIDHPDVVGTVERITLHQGGLDDQWEKAVIKMEVDTWKLVKAEEDNEK